MQHRFADWCLDDLERRIRVLKAWIRDVTEPKRREISRIQAEIDARAGKRESERSSESA